VRCRSSRRSRRGSRRRSTCRQWMSEHRASTESRPGEGNMGQIRVGGGQLVAAEAHSQAILECGRLGLDRRRVMRRRETSPEWHRKPSGPATKALGEVQSESPGRHGGGWAKGRSAESERFEGEARVWLVSRHFEKTSSMQRNFASHPRQARKRPGQSCCAGNGSSCHVARLPARPATSLGICKYGFPDWFRHALPRFTGTMTFQAVGENK
jgi:hypothetical protein